MKKKTLLQKAKKVKMRHRKIIVTDEHIELALAWVKDDITLTQVNLALNKPRDTGNTLYALAVYIREAYRKGQIKIPNNKI